MTSIDPQDRRITDKSAFERHIQTAVGAMIIALVVWVGSTLTENQTALTELKTNVSYMKEDMKTSSMFKTTVSTSIRYVG